MNSITERMKALVSSQTTEVKKYKELEEMTGITAASWRSWWNRGGPPSGEMIEAIGTIWPEYAFWLVTGIDDYKHGHHAPDLHKKLMPRTAARDLFRAAIKMKNWNARHQFDIHTYAQTVHEGTNDATADAIHKEFGSLFAQLEALEQVRTDQETSLQKFEKAEFMKGFLPGDSQD